ncbi:MAG: ATP-binding protein [Lachnospiraceae bacterium]
MYNPNIWWHIGQFIFFMCIVSFLIFKVFEYKLQVSKKIFWVIAGIYTIVVSVILALTLTEISRYRCFSTYGIFLIMLVSIIVATILIRKNIMLLLFLIFIFLNLQFTTIVLAKATLDFEILPRHMSYENGDFILLSSVYCIILFPAIYYLLIKLYKKIIDVDVVTWQMQLFCCLPAGFFFAIYMLIDMNCDTVVSTQKEMLLPLVVINICAYLSYVAAIKAIIHSHDIAIEHAKLYEANAKLLLWEEQYETLQAKIYSEERMRHDWRHHIVTVLGYVEHKDLEGLSEYLAEYKKKYVLTDTPKICDITALDMLFQYYKRKASESGIELSISTVMFNQCQVSVPDLTILFGNLLENAIEACERMDIGTKYITLKVRNNENDLIAIICENSYDGILNQKNNTMVSRKKNGGIGISSVRDIVEKYNGIIEMKMDNKIFKTYIALR